MPVNFKFKKDGCIYRTIPKFIAYKYMLRSAATYRKIFGKCGQFMPFYASSRK